MVNDDHDRAVYDGHYEVEVLIDRPARVVWAQFLDIASWVTSHEVSELSGTRGTEGLISRIVFKKASEYGMPPPHYHYTKLIKVVPERQYVIKTYTEKGGSYGWEGIAFDDTRFIEADGKTRVIFNMYAQIRSDAIAKDPTSVNLEASREGMLENLSKLKRLVEARVQVKEFPGRS